MAIDSAPSIHRVLVEWLSPLGKVSTRRVANDPLPHRVVRRVDGVDAPEVAQDVAVVSVHTFAAGDAAADVEAGLTHQRMVELSLNPLTLITLPGGVLVTIDYCRSLMAPIPVEYSDDPHVVRYVGRYEVGLPYLS
ncbi:head-tail adaptor [Mycobacterium phage KristaRAM]|uniref:Tail terminator n=14 Tax=Cheoctovirus TaxID=1623281 RepID=E7EJM7_9CAUD|nr:head-tail adaptor [Mycobacterium phage Wee]YP_008051136.1 head-tail adaptor [Mycobacterium phage SiSi]YP_009013212.1 head-tail adaptor [Mycobacterium phage SG4]YP_009016900.1 head-tail adaptor [Mycobacterium phage DeadP]YP_009100122.1 head-tail adaptor [Mycobacterium phage Taj]YP_009208751.1 head-tail adaptor [Mycobacterium phage XFactor]YP_009211174.1 head-tail adaptor [Mycobacterium phage Ovechkin]YP_009636423.1 head-tail adaptor [Mycobacterium phage DLane]YP_009955418.1 head-tail adap